MAIATVMAIGIAPEIIMRMSKRDNLFVTQPTLPDLDDFIPYLKDLWDSRWLTNNGKYHQELEEALCDYLGVNHISLFANGTLALVTALQSLRISGEVITTPYSFVATTHSLWWNNIKPVFVDIESNYFNLDPGKIEAAVTPRTTAIVPVHVYGNPCEIEQIERIANTYGLRVIYDAAHAFGVNYKQNSILNYGDLSILSFHATKTFNTMEGGAIICKDAETKQRIDYLKNFGFANETTIVAPGINAKMNEFQAALGILQLKKQQENTLKREKIFLEYCKQLEDVKGIRLPLIHSKVSNYNYPYFPILVCEENFGTSRDVLYDIFCKQKIYVRRYFYPLISEFPMYSEMVSSSSQNLSNAFKISREVLCLPMYTELELSDVQRIISIITNLKG